MFSKLAALSLLPFAFAAPVLNSRDAPTKYLVVMKPGSRAESVSPKLDGVQITHNYAIGDFTGFAANLTPDHVNELKSDPNVAYVEADGIAHTMDAVDQSGAPWGLGRISHRSKGSTDYLYDASGGAGTCAYIIDTGIYTDHAEFEGRATMVSSLVAGSNTDDNGHGTHVSGTIGSRSYGVAKKTKLYGIKVLDSAGSGSWSDVVTGIQTAVSDSKSRSCPNGVVVNMSLGGSKTQTINDAVAAAVQAGLFFAVAAGNDGVDYSSTSPASEPSAFAVGASDNTDALASFSNYGSNLGAIAPGVDVLSIWNTAGGTNTISGTSMATPHIVGLAAYLAGLNGPQSPSAMRSLIQKLATTDKINLGTSAIGTPNMLAYNGIS